jgi:hypothetical protein
MPYVSPNCPHLRSPSFPNRIGCTPLGFALGALGFGFWFGVLGSGFLVCRAQAPNRSFCPMAVHTQPANRTVCLSRVRHLWSLFYAPRLLISIFISPYIVFVYLCQSKKEIKMFLRAARPTDRQTAAQTAAPKKRNGADDSNGQ